MVHLSEEALSELLDGGRVAGADEHLASCEACQRQLEDLRDLRVDLRELPDLEPPVELWSRIATGLPRVRPWRRRLGRPGLIALQAVALAAVFVLGLGLGRLFEETGSEGTPGVRVVAEQPAPGSLAEALAEVRRRGAEYDAALVSLERLARQQGAPASPLAHQRLANLELLVEASRTALSAEPADPVLNSYLFGALEERDAVMREIRQARDAGTEVLWR